MKIAAVSIVEPKAGSGFGITEYNYQLINHIRMLDKSIKIDIIYALTEAKRNNILGLIYTNTLFKKKIKKIAKNNYDIVHIIDHEIGFAAKILKKESPNLKIITMIHDLARFEKGMHRGATQ
ncbi:MAG: hypothetical protein ACP5UN_02385, partial [Candidatus Micrarchaeia archaeon]